MYRFFAFIGKIIIPVLVVVLSIITVLPESGLHIDQLRKDGVYPKIAKEIKKNIFLLDDKMLLKIGFVLPANKDIIIQNPAFTKSYSDLVESSKIETTIKDSIEQQFITLDSNIKTTSTNFDQNTNEGKAGFYANKLYTNRLYIILGIFVLLFLILILGLFKSKKSFWRLSKFYSGLSYNILGLSFLTFIGLAGLGFVGTGTRKLLTDYAGIKNYSVDLLDIVNMSWAKFIFTLLVPALVTLAVTFGLALFFALISVFQRDNKEAKIVKSKMESKESNITKDPQSIETVKLEEVTTTPTQVTQESKNNIKPTNSQNNSFKPVTSNPFPIEESRPREELDPFLDRLSNTLNDTTTNVASNVETNAQKIVLPNEKK